MSELSVRNTGKYGLDVFAERTFRHGETVLQFKGPLLDFDAIEDGSYEDAIVIQIGERTYLGPSGEIDDYVNHSCDPNAGLKFEDEKLFLVALRDISAGEEITFDYSTSMKENHTEILRRCGSPRCRGIVRDFKLLPIRVQMHYQNLGIVPEFILR